MAFVTSVPSASASASALRTASPSASSSSFTCRPTPVSTSTSVSVSLPHRRSSAATVRACHPAPRKRDGDVIRGPVFVVRDNIDTDQIIPAEYLTLVPSDPVEYAKLGTYALDGLPAEEYQTRYVSPGASSTQFPIVVAGNNFGCGSSREHAPVALGAAGGCAVVARSYARIFFRNCSATGELYPWEVADDVAGEDWVEGGGFETGHVAEIDFKELVIRNVTTGKSVPLKSLGDVLPVVDAGGIFEFARRSGMIARK